MGEGEEGADDSGVKLSAAGFVEAAHGFVVGQAFSIGSRRNHGVKRINHADDSGDYRYFGVLQACGIALAIERFVMMENIESRALEAGEHAQNGPSIFGMFFHQGVFVRIEAIGFAENGIGDTHFADVVKERGHFEILKFGFLQAEFLADAHAPFRQAGAVHSCGEVFKIEKLIESADYRIAERGRLFFQLLDAERLERSVYRDSFRGRWYLVVRHWSYLQNKRHVPEPDEEPELFTQAETAW